jgi:hypothetical protein
LNLVEFEVIHIGKQKPERCDEIHAKS